MLAKFIALALLAAVTASPANYGYQPKQEAPPVQHDIDYKVKWEVKDEPSYNYQTREESKYADRVEGSYSLVDPDGTLRTVKYTADANGFVAHVEHKPLTFDAPTYEAPKYDSYSKYEAPQETQSQYQQAAPQHYQQSAPQRSYQSQQSQSQYSGFQANADAGGVTIFSAPPAPVEHKPMATQFSAAGPPKPTYSQSSEVSFRPVVSKFQPTLNFQPQQSEGGSKYH